MEKRAELGRRDVSVEDKFEKEMIIIPQFSSSVYISHLFKAENMTQLRCESGWVCFQITSELDQFSS